MPGTPKSPSHPPVAYMVANAIENLKDRKGSSLSAIKKYIENNFTVRMERLAPYIKRYVKLATYTGTIVQKTGTGATGSFKLPRPQSPKKKTKTAKMGKKVQVSKKAQKRPASPKKKVDKKEKKKSKKNKNKKQRAKKQPGKQPSKNKGKAPKAPKSKQSKKSAKRAKKGKK